MAKEDEDLEKTLHSKMFIKFNFRWNYKKNTFSLRLCLYVKSIPSTGVHGSRISFNITFVSHITECYWGIGYEN